MTPESKERFVFQKLHFHGKYLHVADGKNDAECCRGGFSGRRKKEGKAIVRMYFVIGKAARDFTITLFPSRSQLHCKLLA